MLTTAATAMAENGEDVELCLEKENLTSAKSSEPQGRLQKENTALKPRVSAGIKSKPKAIVAAKVCY